MTQTLAEKAVEVTSKISRLLDGAEETSQLLNNISQLEWYGDFLLPSVAFSPHGKILGPSVISTCLSNQKPSETRYFACCLQKTYIVASFPSIGG